MASGVPSSTLENANTFSQGSDFSATNHCPYNTDRQTSSPSFTYPEHLHCDLAAGHSLHDERLPLA